jgi:hypothetical protein
MTKLNYALDKLGLFQPFVGKPVLKETRGTVKVWTQLTHAYPEDFLHMKQLRFPISKGGYGTIEEATAYWLHKNKLAEKLQFAGNIPWQYFKNHIRECAFEPKVIAINSFLRRKRLKKTDLRKVLRQYNFQGMPDLFGVSKNGIDLWEVKSPLDSHSIKNFEMLNALGELGFSLNLILLSEDDRSPNACAKARKSALNKANENYKSLLLEPVMEKILNFASREFKIQGGIQSLLDYRYSKIKDGPSYLIFVLADYLEARLRCNKPDEFSFSHEDLTVLSKMLFLSGSYHWWRIPVTLLHLLHEKKESSAFVELIRDSVNWEKSFRTIRFLKISESDILAQYKRRLIFNSQGFVGHKFDDLMNSKQWALFDSRLYR